MTGQRKAALQGGPSQTTFNNKNASTSPRCQSCELILLKHELTHCLACKGKGVAA